ncbi:MAG: phosphotransferase [Alphaproteobacteria bacterium]
MAMHFYQHNPDAMAEGKFFITSAMEFLQDELISCQFLSAMTSGGASHQHILLQGKKNNYVMKIFPKQPFAITLAITLQKKLYNFFHAQGVMTPPAIYGDEQCLVLPYFFGITNGWDITKQKYNDKALAKSLAIELAKIHDSKKPFRMMFPNICYQENFLTWRHKKMDMIKKLLRSAEPMASAELDIAHRAIEKLFISIPQNLSMDFVPCHGDFRTGNFLLEPKQQGHKLVAVLDWEMVGFGLPEEDIGWLSAICWLYHQPEFGCGGFAQLDIFLEEYISARQTMQFRNAESPISNMMVNHSWFQSLAMIRWGLILSKQWHRKQSGLDILPELPQESPDLITIFHQAIKLLS